MGSVDGVDLRRRTWRAGRGALHIHALSTFSVAVAFLCLAAALLIVTNVAALRDRWARAGRATVYLRDATTDAEVLALAAALEKTPGVKKVRHLTSSEARREIIVDEQDQLASLLPQTAFPSSLEVGLSDDFKDADLAAMEIKLRALPAVESVETYKRWTERLSLLLESAVAASVGLAAVVLAAVVSIIGCTMLVLLHRRRLEVEVLKLVGATDAFVRRPFVVEGAAQGAAGAASALIILGALYLTVRARFDQDVSVMCGLTPSFLPWPIMLALVALGGLLGSGTAFLSIRRMVKV